MSIIKVTDATFDQKVLGADRPVFVDFWANWCAPCRAVAPVLEEIAEELKNVVTIAKVDVDESPNTAMKYRIQSIPTFLLFDQGKLISGIQGAQPKPKFLQFLESHVPALKPPTISVQQLAAMLEKGNTRVIDIRDERDFARSHIRGAECVQVGALDAKLATLAAGNAVVLVCRTGETSKVEAAKRVGMPVNVVALEKGLLEWEGSGKPTFSTKEEQELAS